MKRDTRQDILNTAQTLFREKGYNADCVGEIAAALGISKGIRTYYLRRKEAIVEALLESANPTFPQDPPQTLAQLDACLRDMEQARENNAFYFPRPHPAGSGCRRRSGPSGGGGVPPPQPAALPGSGQPGRPRPVPPGSLSRGVRPGGGHGVPHCRLLAALL